MLEALPKKLFWGYNLPHPITLKRRISLLARGGRGLDVINHAKFQLDRYRNFGAPGGRKLLSPIDWRYRPYNSVRTNVTCEKIRMYTVYSLSSNLNKLLLVTETSLIISMHRRTGEHVNLFFQRMPRHLPFNTYDAANKFCCMDSVNLIVLL